MKNLPHSSECESSLLGCILLSPDILNLVSIEVGVDDFFVSNNREIFSSMLRLHAKNVTIDIATLATQLKTDGSFERVGGTNALLETFNSTASAANFKHYCEIVKQKSSLRNIISLASDLHNRCFDEITSEVVCTMLNSLQSAVSSVINNKQVLSSDLDVLVSEQFDRAIAIQDGTYIEKKISTGFPSVDKHINGLHEGHLVVLAGRPGSGKTALAVNIILAAIKSGAKSIFYSLEMTRNELAQRVMSQTAKISLRNLNNGLLTVDDKERLAEFKQREYLKNLTISENNATPAEIAIDVDLWNQSHPDNPVRVVVIDHLQLIGTYDSKRYERRDRQLAEYTARLKDLAKTKNLTVLLLSQLNRAADARGTAERAPKLSDLRDSGATEQDADIVLGIHRKELESLKTEDANDATLLILKNRNGVVGRIQLTWVGIYTMFAEQEVMRVEPVKYERKPHYTEPNDVFLDEM